MDEKEKAKFLQTYSNLPINERKNIIVVIEEDNKEKQPISWDIAYIEIDKETEIGIKILKKLIKLDLI